MPRARLAAAMIGGALCLALLSACADMQDQMQDALGGDGDDEPRTLAFECDDDRDFTVRLSGDRQEARVEVDDRTYRLEETEREGGRRVYRDDDNEVRLIMSDGEADLRLEGAEDYQNCERT
jgi:membrane-bound inhibitor of C-type lysozyme